MAAYVAATTSAQYVVSTDAGRRARGAVRRGAPPGDVRGPPRAGRPGPPPLTRRRGGGGGGGRGRPAECGGGGGRPRAPPGGPRGGGRPGQPEGPPWERHAPV